MVMLNPTSVQKTCTLLYRHVIDWESHLPGKNLRVPQNASCSLKEVDKLVGVIQLSAEKLTQIKTALREWEHRTRASQNVSFSA